jgi:hypothetical protein
MCRTSPPRCCGWSSRFHARGWSVGGRRSAAAGSVVPARARMGRSRRSSIAREIRRSRACADGPQEVPGGIIPMHDVVSTRRVDVPWATNFGSQYARSFPRARGCARHARAASLDPASFPRARGCTAEHDTTGEDTETSSPRARGCTGVHVQPPARGIVVSTGAWMYRDRGETHRPLCRGVVVPTRARGCAGDQRRL